MYLNKDFKLVKRNKYIIWSIIGFVFLCAIALFIVTSWYKFDLDISNFFYRAMDYSFFRGWTGYFIIDANLLIVAILVPVVFVLIEGLYAYLKKNKPNSFGARHYQDKKYFYLFIAIAFPIMAFIYMGFFIFKSQGFGVGFYMWEMIGLEFTIPIYVVSCLLDIAICYGLLYYVWKDLSRREDFLSSRRWSRSFVVILFTVFVYVVVLILKSGMGRPYPLFMNWDNYIDKLKSYSMTRYKNYIDQSTFNYGWNNGSLTESVHGEWPWYKIAKGFFNKHTDYYQYLPKAGDAFPSGHMGMTSIVLASLWFVLFSDADNKKQSKLKWIMVGVGLFYGLNLFFSLLISENHWMSDLSFTLICTPIEFIISYYAVNGIIKGVTGKSTVEVGRE